MATTRVFLLRHGETDRPDLFHGAESDPPLSRNGRLEAQAAGRWLAGRTPGSLYCSGLRRARDTASIIGRHLHLAPLVVPALHERRIGPMSGKPRSEANPIYEQTCKDWMNNRLDATHEGGESYAAMRERTLPAFIQIAHRHRGSATVVVAHGMVMRVLMTSLAQGYTPADWHRIPIRNGAINELVHDGVNWCVAGLDQL